MFLDADGETPDTGIAQRPVKTLIECREQLKSKQRLNAGQNHSRLFQSLLDFRLERLAFVIFCHREPMAYQSELRRPRF
jgi:hypothetical protein